MDRLDFDIQRILERERQSIAQGYPPEQLWYGVDQALHAWLEVPTSIALNATLQHGVLDRGIAMPSMLQAKGLVFVYNQQIKACFPEEAHHRVFVSGSPFMRYRQVKNIAQSPRAAGTIAFPAHATHFTDINFDIEEYARSLLALPEVYQPVTVCVYWKDILHGRHQVYLDAGLDVCTMGHIFDPFFLPRFYRTIRRFKYVTANKATSGLYLATELGLIPFLQNYANSLISLQGEGNIPTGEYHYKPRPKGEILAEDLFRRIPTEEGLGHDHEINAFVDMLLGKHESDSVETLRLAWLEWAPYTA